MFRLIASLLVVLVCGLGYVVFGHSSEGSSGSSDASASQQAAPAQQDNSNDEFKNLKVN